MSLITARVAAALVAIATGFTIAACSTAVDSNQGGQVGPGIPETPVITGEPASYNAEDVSFATNMITHHKQAIELSELVPERTTNPELAALASQIAAVQQPEINIMNVFLVQWKENPEAGAGPSEEDHSDHGSAMPGMVDDATITKLESLRGKEFDTLWLQSMISHHRGAVDMANAEIANGANIDAVAMAKTIAATQESEIEQMQQMLEGSQR